MDKQIRTLTPVLAGTRFIDGQAFAGDSFQRKQQAERLTGYLDRLREGAVLAIDAPCSGGKTWFGRNWATQLQAAGHRVVFIDAFEQEYVEEPFLLIAAEIADALDDGQGAVRALREKTVSVMTTIMPMRYGTAPGPAGRWMQASGTRETAGATAESAAVDAGSWIAMKLNVHAMEKASFQHFRNELAASASTQPKSLVLFIDELDRCHPTFALKLIERLKHLFTVPNLVFVLLIDRNQLHHSIRRGYGLDAGAAAAYLGKFVDFFFALPRSSYDDSLLNQVAAHVEHAFHRYDFNDAGGPENFKRFFTWTAAWFNLSMRDIERAVALYAFAHPLDRHHCLLAYVITLKIAKPGLFRRLRQGNDPGAHREALNELKSMRARTASAHVYHYLALLIEWHEAHIIGFPTNGETFTLRLREYDQASQGPLLWHDSQYDETPDARRLFQQLADRIDGTN